MIYITGDTHRSFSRIHGFCQKMQTDASKDMMIILGDAGINYYLDERDRRVKDGLQKYCNIKLFIIRGNHEERPSLISSYKTGEFCGGTVYYEDRYPNLIFAKDGETYTFGDKRCFVVGGAYSVDKYYRLERGMHWFESEQLSRDEQRAILSKVFADDSEVFACLTHTCPFSVIPTEMFIRGVDQSTVDNTMEDVLEIIYSTLNFKRWYCGHYHTDKDVDNVHFLFEHIDVFDYMEAPWQVNAKEEK